MKSARSSLSKALPESLKSHYRLIRSRVARGYRSIRVRKLLTNILGPQFSRSRKFIEIDITYACNLKCLDCNRSCSRAPSGKSMDLGQIEKFIAESREQGIRWERIRLLGGEPSLHPKILEILDLLLRYREDFSKKTLITITTNGYGQKVNSVLQKLPREVMVRNTLKDSCNIDTFYSFNLAPIDLPAVYGKCDYANGCDVIRDCGIGLTPYGYYPCGIAGSIDRVFRFDLGRKQLPSVNDDMTDLLEVFCKYCGRFKYSGYKRRIISPTWERAYAEYKKEKPSLSLY